MGLASVRSLPAIEISSALDTSTFDRKFVEFWRMIGQKYNPSSRTKKSRQEYKELRASIKEHGITQPLVLTSDYEKIDGHVRSAIGVELGISGTNCLIAPFDSSDPRADLLYKLLNQRVKMTPAQKLEIHAKGGLASNGVTSSFWRDAKKNLGETGYHMDLFRQHGFKPQLLRNCGSVAGLVFNNSILTDRSARESYVWRKVMQWQCTGEDRQEALKKYCTKISKGAIGFSAKKLWKAIEAGTNIEV